MLKGASPISHRMLACTRLLDVVPAMGSIHIKRYVKWHQSHIMQNLHYYLPFKNIVIYGIHPYKEPMEWCYSYIMPNVYSSAPRCDNRSAKSYLLLSTVVDVSTTGRQEVAWT